MLVKKQMLGSMSSKDNCYDNARMERFFGTIKNEPIIGETLRSAKETKQATGSWIVLEYNAKRPHSALANITPCAFEEELSGRI